MALTALSAAAAVAAPEAWAADPQPGAACAPNGTYAQVGAGWVQCVNGTYQPSGPPSPGTSSGNPPASGGSGGTTTVATAKIFQPVGTALSQQTFGSTGKQVADPAAFRLPDGRVRIYAFVNNPTGTPGLKVATSTDASGLAFVADAADPFPGTPVGQPRAFQSAPGSVRLFFVEGGNVNTAVSSDGGLTFTREGTVLTTAQAGFEPGVFSVIKVKGGYRAYFSNLEKPGEHAARIMRTATSTDLLHWKVGPKVVKGGGSHPFAVIDRKGRIALYYAADRGSKYGLLVSTSDDGVHFSGEKLVIEGSADADIIPAASGRYLMYYGADLGADGFGVKVARSVSPVVPAVSAAG